MKAAIIALVLSFATLCTFAADKDPVVGRWKWENIRQAFLLNADGTASKGVLTGKWVCLTPTANPRKYQISWDNGLFVDTLSLVKKGTELVGKNKENVKLRATRLPQ